MRCRARFGLVFAVAAAGCAPAAAPQAVPSPLDGGATVPRGSAPALLNPFIAFYAAFDGSVAADLATGSPEPVGVDGTARFVPGRFGSALLLGERGGGARVHYASQGNLDFGRPGAVSFWISPVRWIAPGEAPERGILALLVRRARAGGSFGINRTGFRTSIGRVDHLNSGFFDLPGIKLSYVQVRGTEGWKQGEWHLLVLNWTRSGFTFSVDAGEFAPSEFPVPLPAEAFRIGGRESPFSIGNPLAETTAMDELTIYSRPLRFEEVRGLYGAE